jgi:phosphatidylglycerol:prolipoprotein diacylglycerol transferase
MYPRLLHVGPFVLPTYGGMVALALVAAFFLATRTARRMGLHADRVWNLCILVTLTALLGARAIYLVMHWSSFREAPAWILGVSVFRSPASWYGGLALAGAAGLIYLRAARLPLRATLDALAAPLALGGAIANLGALLAGQDFGTASDLPWAVTYRSRLASLWYGTPLGAPLHPVQAYLALAELALFAGLVVWLTRRWPRGAAQSADGSAPVIPGQAGELFAVWLFVEGLARFFADMLRPTGARTWMAGGVMSVTQCVAAGMVVTAAVLWWRRSPADGSAG